MFVSVYTLSGIAIATIIPNPLISLPQSFGGHFLLDALPHWNPLDNNSKKRFVNFSAITDFVIAVGICFYFYQVLLNPLILYSAFLASVMDLDAFLYGRVYKDYAISWRLFPHGLSKFHRKIQNETSFLPGVLMQLVVIVICLGLIYAGTS